MRKRYLVAIGCLVGGLMFSLVGARSISAQSSVNSKITQNIFLIDCTKTITQNGTQIVTDTRCNGAVTPTVDPLKTSNRNPIISGNYDSGSTDGLRVYISGRWYTLGKDSNLTTNGNRWFLDLSSEPQLAIGTHQVIVEVITKSGLLLRNQDSGEIIIISQGKIGYINDRQSSNKGILAGCANNCW